MLETGAPLVPLTLHSMKPPSQNRKFILALYRAHQMYLIPNGQRRIWVTLRGTRCHPDTRVWTLQMCPEAAAQFRALQELLSSAEVIYSANLLICSPPQQIINIQHTPLSSLALSQLWVLRVYRFSSQILQLYMIPPPHTHCHQLPPSNSKSIYCSTYWQPKDIGLLMGLKEPSFYL